MNIPWVLAQAQLNSIETTVRLSIDDTSMHTYNAGNKYTLERGLGSMKYTSEQKTAALKSIEEIGVAKTVEAMKISAQTLYKWRNEAKAAPSSQTGAALSKETLDAQELLENDRLLQEKISLLEAENKALRATLIKYRAALAAVLEEVNE